MITEDGRLQNMALLPPCWCVGLALTVAPTSSSTLCNESTRNLMTCPKPFNNNSRHLLEEAHLQDDPAISQCNLIAMEGWQPYPRPILGRMALAVSLTGEACQIVEIKCRPNNAGDMTPRANEYECALGVRGGSLMRSREALGLVCNVQINLLFSRWNGDVG